MARRSALRASDADRERFAERLRSAATEGRLVAEELEDRLGAALRARTYGELDALVADLPRGAVAERRRPRGVVRAVRSLPPGALVVLAPITLAVIAATLVVLATLFIVSAVVIAVLWLAFGHRVPMALCRGRRSAYHLDGGRARAR